MPKTSDPAEKKSGVFSNVEQEAMRARSKELREEARMNKNREEGERSVLAAIEAMGEEDRTMAEKIHNIVLTAAPHLMPKTWYGMPAYANKDGKVICFYQAASKFETRYATFGFQPEANLDEGNMWPASFALIKLTAAEEAKIADMVKKAVS